MIAIFFKFAEQIKDTPKPSEGFNVDPCLKHQFNFTQASEGLAIMKVPMIGKIILYIFISLSILFAREIPSSERSREVIRRIEPELRKRVESDGFLWGNPIFIRIFKEEQLLEIWMKKDSLYYLFKQYPICDFSNTLGPKLAAGDCRSPEGFYFVPPRYLNPNSNYHLSINIGYPNLYEQAHHWTGSAIVIHGNCVSIGCFAMGDSLIEEIYTIADAALRNGQRFFRVHIFPFQMTATNMELHRNSKWIDFWGNLKEGYDFFEQYRVPPDVILHNGLYVFKKWD